MVTSEEKHNMSKTLAEETEGKDLIKQIELEQKFLATKPELTEGEMSDILLNAQNLRDSGQKY